ncbi:flagellar hook protein FlgE [Kineococcus gynurae]|uniref:Flagellar hook protein FlgE n=2 Tax=Kineococcus gynurae TaxID=452979 RepID=A0ABV5LR54_9ACTN
MFSGVSGLRSHQTMMDVVGNNIANVNTTGYKSSSVIFGDTLSQLTTSAAAPQNGVGGTNPAQVGLGVRVNAVTNNFTQGSAQTTGKATDMMIQGDGFFVVKQGEASFYTRAGSFSLDTDGNLITPDGSYVQGWTASGVDGTVNANQPTGRLNVPVGKILPSTPTDKATIGGNLDPSSSIVPPATTASNDGVATTAFTAYDALGTAHLVTGTFTQDSTDATKWSVAFTYPGQSTADAADATANLVFSAAGKPDTGSDASATVKVNGVDVVVDLSTLTGFDSPGGAGIKGGKSEITQGANGAPVGTLTSFTLNPDGTLTGAFTNGMKSTLGQVAIATFNNPAGLEKSGNSMFTVTTNSGAAQVGVANAGGRGKLLGGQLEMSNVDLSNEFTNLILAQRGFQANSRIITASDEILQDVVNLKR